VQQADDVALVELQAELVLVLPRQELDEGILADDEVLALLHLVKDRREVRHQELSEGADLLRRGQLLHDLHQDLVDLFEELVLLEILDVAARPGG
jgi:hypothetical protein